MSCDSIEIICIAGAPWNAPIWTNRQQVMSRLSAKYEILYVDPPHSFLGVLKNSELLKRIMPRLIEKNKNLHVYTPPLVFPFFATSLFINKVNTILISLLINKAIKKLKMQNAIIWLYDPLGYYYIGRLHEKLVCYDCIDEHTGFAATTKRKNIIHLLEQRILDKADLVFTTAKSLYDRKKRYNLNTYLTPNVGDISLFMKTLLRETKVANELLKIKKPIIGFLGAINFKIDWELIKYIARFHPEWSLVMIGPIDKFSIAQLKSLNNVYFLGKKEVNVLPNYIKGFDVCMIPYLINEYTKSVFPLKFHEYMASGKPIVTTDLPELRAYKDVINIAKEYSTFERGITRALNENNKDLVEKRVEMAKQNSWEKKIEVMIGLIQGMLKETDAKRK